MNRWRDTNGRTAAERKKLKAVGDRSRFAADVRQRPLTLLRGIAGFALILLLAFALIGFLR
jgi:hypothetical protein